MKPYIFIERNGIHIIDLQKSVDCSRRAHEAVKKTVERGDSVLFIGTKKQAKTVVEEEARRCDEGSFRERFRRSPVKRARRRGLLRNVAVALGNAGAAALRPVLERLAGDEDPVVREHAGWALRRLDARRLSPGAGSS